MQTAAPWGSFGKVGEAARQSCCPTGRLGHRLRSHHRANSALDRELPGSYQ